MIKDPNNAAKCREYRVRGRAKKEKEIRDFQHQLTKNMKLKAEKADTIRKLKAYYIKFLKSKKYKCMKHESDSPASTTMPSSVDSEVEMC